MTPARPIALLLTPVLPQPGHSGRALRAWDWLKTLSAAYRVHVLLASGDGSVPDLSADYPAEAVWPVALRKMPRPVRAAGLLVPPLAALSEAFVCDWAHPAPDALPDELRALLTREGAARVVVFRMYMHAVARAVRPLAPQAAFDLDVDDLEPQTRWSVGWALIRLHRYVRAGRSLSLALQYAAVQRRISGYRHVYLAAEDDCARLPQGIGRSIRCWPNRLNLPAETAAPPARDVAHLLFLGALDYAPNEDAVRFMVARVLPELASLRQPYSFTVVGRHASPKLKRLLSCTAHVELIENADQLDAIYGNASIVVAPLRSGGGSKLKALEAFSYRRPLVGSDHSARGLSAVPDRHYLSASDGPGFALAIRKLHQNPALADAIAGEGFELFKARFCRQDCARRGVSQSSQERG